MPVEVADQLVALLPRLRRYALVLTRAAEAADDLVQSACERALATEHGPGAGVPFDAWMLRIVRNLWIDRARRQRSEGTAVDIDDHLDEAATHERAPDTAELADARRTLARVRGAIDALPDDQREIVLLVCAEGLAYREAAELLGVPIGTVMSRLARARAKLAALARIDQVSTGISSAATRLGENARRSAAAPAAVDPEHDP
jgi:RNA polymerase sigma-70 factor (ECF subfamily)